MNNAITENAVICQTPRLSSAALKYAASAIMLVDHIGMILLKNVILAAGAAPEWLITVYALMRAVGRAAFPLYAFLLAEGAKHTGDRRKYLLRLMGFGILSEPIHDITLFGRWFYTTEQNVLFTMAAGLMAIMLWDACRRNAASDGHDVRSAVIGALGVSCIAAGAEFLNLSYGACGVAAIFFAYVLSQNRFSKNFAMSAILMPISALEAFTVIAWPLMSGYSGERGKHINKYAFYIFYPAHLILICLLTKAILGQL